jgi:cytochrome c-type protein NapB
MKRDLLKSDSHRKSVPVAVVVLLTCAASGYFMGLRQTASLIAPQRQAEPAAMVEVHGSAIEEEKPAAAAPGVVDYARLKEVNYKPNAEWSNDVRNLLQPGIDLLTATNKASAQELETARLQRGVNRAFGGAPPTVPHPIDQASSAACLACHENGAKIKDRFAAKISHAHYGSCTQCHVPARGTGLLSESERLSDPLAENLFAGWFSPNTGSRAYAGAPPTVPHPTTMRSDCLSCHGPGGQVGLRTSHPARQSCTQCHAPSAELDQRQILAFDFPALPPESGWEEPR